MTARLSRRRALALAWPMIFANAAAPLAGVADTFVIGAAGDAADLGGVALGTTILNVVLMTFYFLRMGSSGLAAQAAGAGRTAETQRVVVRAAGLGLAMGAAVLACGGLLSWAGFAILQGGPEAEAAGAAYFGARIWGAPGALAVLALTGWLIGVGRTGAVLAVLTAFSGVNVILDLVFVLGFGWGVAGVGAATAIADWTAAGVAGVCVWAALRAQGGLRPEAFAPAALFDAAALKLFFAMNRDMMLRSWALLFGFAWFVNAAATQSTEVLAGTHVLMQFVAVWAFVLDAFAFTAETEVGKAYGARDRARLRRAIRVTSELAVGAGFAFMLTTLALGPAVLDVVVADPAANAAAKTFLPYCAVIPLIGAPAWQLDGVFIGATRSAAMRNASIAAAALYVALDRLMTPALGPHGLWSAFVIYYLFRAATLAAAYPALERALTAQTGTSAPTASATDA